MFTKNWYNGLMGVLTGKIGNIVSYNKSNYTVGSLVGSNWLQLNSGKGAQYPYIGYVTKLTDVGGVIFGNGTTQPTINDYKLNHNLLTHKPSQSSTK